MRFNRIATNLYMSDIVRPIHPILDVLVLESTNFFVKYIRFFYCSETINPTSSKLNRLVKTKAFIGPK